MQQLIFRMRVDSSVRFALVLALTACLGAGAAAQKADTAKTTDSRVDAAIGGLTLRSIGPALTSGRVADIAVDPTDHRIWYVAAAAGGVWKTTNAGISYTPVFDGQGSFSIGTITIDPKNPAVVWVGTGENNAQRVVAYGDGLYKSLDGGRSWKNVGLKNSEHIARIEIDPRNSDIVYVAAQGPLWSKGGDRGLYKTTDGGATGIRTRSSRRRGSACGGRTVMSEADRAPPCSDRPTAARRGRSRSPGFQRWISGASASPARPPILPSSTRSPKQRRTRAASSARATAGRAGRR